MEKSVKLLLMSILFVAVFLILMVNVSAININKLIKGIEYSHYSNIPNCNECYSNLECPSDYNTIDEWCLARPLYQNYYFIHCTKLCKKSPHMTLRVKKYGSACLGCMDWQNYNLDQVIPCDAGYERIYTTGSTCTGDAKYWPIIDYNGVGGCGLWLKNTKIWSVCVKCHTGYKNCDNNWENGCECPPGKVCEGTNCVYLCNCGSWQPGACGGGNCVSSKRLHTRTCTPAGCDYENKCVNDPTCGVIIDCDSCEDCSQKLNSAASGSTVRLIQNIIDNRPGSTICIDWNYGSGVLFDCQDYNISGIVDQTEDVGIYVANGGHSIVENCVVKNFDYGIQVWSINTLLFENIVCNNQLYDIYNGTGTAGSYGFDNTCDDSHNWNDQGTTGCTNPCTITTECDQHTDWVTMKRYNGVHLDCDPANPPAGDVCVRDDDGDGWYDQYCQDNQIKPIEII